MQYGQLESLEQEDAAGRFLASLAVRREIFDRIGGWPLTKRGDFDQQLIARLNAIERPGDPCQFAEPSYIFRWGQTNAYHGQRFRQGPEDEGVGDRESEISRVGGSRYQYCRGIAGRALAAALAESQTPAVSEFQFCQNCWRADVSKDVWRVLITRTRDIESCGRV